MFTIKAYTTAPATLMASLKFSDCVFTGHLIQLMIIESFRSNGYTYIIAGDLPVAANQNIFLLFALV